MTLRSRRFAHIRRTKRSHLRAKPAGKTRAFGGCRFTAWCSAMFDVVIAGGGPAGSSAALALAENGLHALIVDKSHFPRTKACGEYLSAGAVELLRTLGLERGLAPLASPLDGIRLSGNG